MPTDSGLQMSFSADSPEGFLTVQFNGSLDESTALDARARVDQMAEGHTFQYLVFDFTNLTYMNSKGISFLVSTHAHIAKDQKKLIIAGANQEVSDVMALVGIDTILKTVSNLKGAYGEK